MSKYLVPKQKWVKERKEKDIRHFGGLSYGLYTESRTKDFAKQMADEARNKSGARARIVKRKNGYNVFARKGKSG